MKAVTAAIGDYGSKAHRSVIAMDDKRNAGQANPAMFALTSPARVCYIEEVGNVTFDLDKAKNIASGGTEKSPRHAGELEGCRDYGNPYGC